MTVDRFSNILALQGTPLNEEALQTFESKFSVKFPDDYRSFIMKRNGGVPAAEVSGHCLQEVYTLSEIKDAHASYNSEGIFRMPKELICIIHNGFGDNYCINISDENFGKIYLWKHDDETLLDEAEECSLSDYRNVQFVADSFTIFVSNLQIAGSLFFPESENPEGWMVRCEERINKGEGDWCLWIESLDNEGDYTYQLAKVLHFYADKISILMRGGSTPLFHGTFEDLSWVGKELCKHGVITRIAPDFEQVEVFAKVADNSRKQFRTLQILMHNLKKSNK